MKSNLKKRLLAMVLCVVMVLGLSISVMAEAEPAPEGAGTEALMLSEGETSQTEGAADNSSETPVTTAAEPAPEAAPEPTPEATPAPEATPEPTPEATPAPEVSPEPTPETTPAPTVTGEPAPETESAGTENVTESTEPVQETEESQKEPALTEESGTEKNQDTEEAEKIITLESKLDDMTVVLSGPESSFPEDTELSISVSEPAKEAEELIEEAVQKQAEEQQMAVRDYTALDIRLLSDGEEIQPLGPVQVVFEKPETETAVQSEEQVETKVFHVDEQTGDAEDMKAEQAEEGQVSIETTHFSIYVVVDMDQLGGQIDLTVQHWATIEVLNGVDGKDGLVGIQGPNGTAGDNVVKLDTKEEFYQIYTDDVIKLDNKLNKNVGELSKVLLADANSTIKNYELKEIWVLKDNQTLGTNTINKTDTNAFDGEKSKWTVYTLDDKDQTVKLTKNSIIRMIYEPVKADNALIQDVTFYDYDVTDGKRYNEKGQEDSNGQWLNTTNQGINNALNYSEGNSSNRLAVGQASAFVDHSYRDARAANGEILNHGGDDSDSAKKGIVTSIGQDGPTYNGVYDAGLFNNDLKIGKTILNNYDLVFNQNGDTYTLTAVNKDGSRVLSNLEVLKDVYDGKAWPSGTKQIFSNNFWPLDTEDLTGHDPLMGAYSGQWKSLNNKLSAAPSDDNTAHNWFFGMRYSFEFTLGDYTGPLNFYFRGDDDFWLFVDGELKTDLGGIHSSIGEILDLTPYVMKNPSAGATEAEKNTTHKIEIVYAERGAYGSTCYMQFTLPNVKPVEFDTETPKTSVTVNKVWNDHNNPNRPASIDVELYYRVTGTEEWTKYDTQTLSTANNWTYTWHNMPEEGYEYKVHEVGEENGRFERNYITAYSEKGGLLTKNPDGTFSGTITNSGSPSTYITVTKKWDDGDNANSSRPDSVDFYLYYRNQANTEWIQYPNGKLTLTADGNWTGTYDNLPVYWGDTNQKMIYTVMEVNGNDALSNGDKLPGKTTGFEYTVSYPKGYIGTDNFGTGYEAKSDNTEIPQETLNLTVTNSLGVSIKVNKEWRGRDPENGTVIYAGLYKAGQSVADKWVELKADNSWTATFQYLSPANDYSVKELRKAESGETPEFKIKDVINNVEVGYVGVNSGSEASVGNGDTAIKYVVSYSSLTPDTTDSSLSNVTITNQAQWQLMKYSSSDADKSKGLEDAKFELKHTDGTVYTGVSDKDGIVKWKIGNQDFTGVFPDGSYTLTETVAPTGYMLGDPVTFEMEDGVPLSMSGENAVIKDGILTFYYANEILYTLPSTGGPGIHWYIIGGMLLMTAGTLVLYKNRCRGGAERVRK